ncbi:hypothetical protein [Actinomadura coerulea]|uniref:hypothetical protein n=1 Tax=Actinomadura coerulea TaxID=46159 RepID=UPI003413CCCB
MLLLAQLIRLLPGEDPDEEWEFDDTLFDKITELTKALIASADPRLVPELERHLESFFEREDFYGRDVVGEVLAGIAGLDALPTLLRAWPRTWATTRTPFRRSSVSFSSKTPSRHARQCSNWSMPVMSPFAPPESGP